MMAVRPADRALLHSALLCILPTALVSVAVALLWARLLRLGADYPVKASAVFLAGTALVLRGLPGHHPFATFGPANGLTLARGALVALLAGLAGERADTGAPAVAMAGALLVVVLDGLDGRLARRTGMTSGFGARFDLETDALLTLVLAVLAWRFGGIGGWVLLSGLLRYAFLAAGLALPRLRRPLPRSRRRQWVSVVQLAGLVMAMAPFIPPGLRIAISALTLCALVLSFLADTVLLLRPAPTADIAVRVNGNG